MILSSPLALGALGPQEIILIFLVLFLLVIPLLVVFLVVKLLRKKPPTPSQQQPPMTRPSPESRLAEIERLKAAGVISEQEYQTKRAEILAEI
ncbi:MAG: c-type cytochrome biogenesis protein CcmI [Verrucomicrobiota bacterium]